VSFSEIVRSSPITSSSEGNTDFLTLSKCPPPVVVDAQDGL
jgi:hypothetical protein